MGIKIPGLEEAMSKMSVLDDILAGINDIKTLLQEQNQLLREKRDS